MLKLFFITAYRNLIKNRIHATLNILGLTIGVFVCLVIGIWLQRELSFDNFHPNEKQLYRLTNIVKSESESFSQAHSAPAFGAQLPVKIASVQSACRLFGEVLKVKPLEEPFIENKCFVVDSNFFGFFGFELVRGQKEQVLNKPDQVVLTEKLAIKYFGSIDNAVGKNLIIDDRYNVMVSGIAKNSPQNSQIQFDLLRPFAYLKKVAADMNYDIDNAWTGGWPFTYIRIADPSQWQIVEKQINDVAYRAAEKELKENKMSQQYFLQPVRDVHLKSKFRYDFANNGNLARVNIFAIVGIIVLLMACINYINLTTAGAIKRAKETSVKKVVGSTRIQLIKQFFFETLLTSAIAVLLAVVLISFLLPVFSQWIDQNYSFEFSEKNILLLLGFVLFVSAIAGVYPAMILSSFKPAVSLKGNFSLSARGNFIRRSLVVFQFTMGIGLIASLIIISQQVNYIKNKSLGYNGNAVVEVKFYGEQVFRNQYTSFRSQLLESPYILNVTKHADNVVGGLGNNMVTTENMRGDEISTSLYGMGADTNFFDTYNMRLAAGRFFSSDFPTDTNQAVLVNEAAVRTFGWQTPENALGKRFGRGNNAQYVIGVVKDFNFENLHKPIEALVIRYARGGNTISLKIDLRHTDEALNHLTKVWKSAVPGIPLQYNFVDDAVNKQYGNETKMQGVFYGFATLSVLIACLGLFGLSIFVVERKLKEIGIRKVLGASVPGVITLISKEFVILVLLSLLIATPLSWLFMNEWLKDFAYRIPISWTVFMTAGGVALLIAIITISFQAIKAAIANPIRSLRTE